MKEKSQAKMLQRTIETQIIIDAEPELIWKILADFPSWQSWNPFIPQIDGNLKEGEQVRIKVLLPGASAMTFRPQLYEVIPNEKILWGSTVLKIIFKGEHAFILQPLPHGKTLFRQVESFSGPFIFFMKSTLKKTKEGHEMMNRALKEKVENQ